MASSYRKPKKRKSSLETVRPKRAKPRVGDDDEDGYNSSTASSVQFWKQDTPENAAHALWTWIDRLRPLFVSWNLRDLVHEAIYEGEPLGAGGVAGGIGHLQQRKSAPANLNITRSMVDTATARLTKRRPMPVVSADDAGWSEKMFAKKTSRILRRKMGGTELEKVSPQLIRDMCIRDACVAKVVRNGGDTKTERIPVYELVYDPRESYYGTPRTLAHHRPVARDVLRAQYGDSPEILKAIEDAPAFRRDDPWTRYAYGDNVFTDQIEVAEGWHLPSAPGCDDGGHVIAIRGCTLFREKWKRPRYPICWTQWSAPTRGNGIRGGGLVFELAGVQAKVNDICRDIQEALYFGSMLKVFTPRGSNVNKHHLRARHPVVIEHDGAIPQFVAPNPVSAQSVAFLELLIQKGYEIAGISQMSASSKNTLGSNASGKAIDTMDDIQSDRFAHVEAGYMQFRVEIGQLHIDEARAMYCEAHEDADEWKHERGEGEVVGDKLVPKDLAPWISEHEWDKVEIDEGNYHLTVEPINFIPDSRAGKLSAVAELSKAGLIPDPTMTADLFDEPDIARANRSILGPKHRLDEIMEALAEPSVPMLDLLPDVYDNLPLGILMAKGELKDAQAHKAPPEILDRYHQWIEAAEMERKKAATGAPSLPGMQATNMGAAPNAAGLQGMGAPGAPPIPMGPQGMPPGMAA